FSGFVFYHFLYGKEENIVFPISLKLSDINSDVYGHVGEDIIAKSLAKRVRVLCMIMTFPAHHEEKAVAVRDTWASRCNAHIFLSSVVNRTLPSVAAVVNESREALWDKMKFAIHFAAKNYAVDYDFFLKADDDTFVVVENLRKLLANHSPEDPFIMGRRFRPYVKQGYLSGGGGYVMSRAALLNIHMGLLREKECAGNESGGAEDVRIGKCAEVVGVRLIDSLDPFGLERFHPFGPSYMMSKVALTSTTWFEKYNYHKISTVS
ncbi:glycoprotein-N-acetylgalactosamine 3-beta-galactosyltransferase, partial [Paragonimus westermani]